MYQQDPNRKYMILWIFLLAIVFYFLLGMFMQGCTTIPKNVSIVDAPVKNTEPQAINTPIPIKTPSLQKALSWELKKPERIEWSKVLYKFIDKYYSTLDLAKDMTKYCPKYPLLTMEEKKNVWAEFFVALSYYESAWNPLESDQDQGDEGELDTYSDGLFQVSGADWENYNLQKELPRYSHKKLLTATPNINLALALMSRQIKKQGLICVSSDVYWATLSCKVYAPYQQNDGIAAKVQRLSQCR